MKRLLLITLLLLSSGPAYGEWVSLGESEEEITVYVDPDTIRGKGNLVKMWHLFDLKTIQTYRGSSFVSIKAQRQYDCLEERSRLLREIGFSNKMGRGNVVYSFSITKEWKPVAPASNNLLLWGIACGKK